MPEKPRLTIVPDFWLIAIGTIGLCSIITYFIFFINTKEKALAREYGNERQQPVPHQNEEIVDESNETNLNREDNGTFEGKKERRQKKLEEQKQLKKQRKKEVAEGAGSASMETKEGIESDSKSLAPAALTESLIDDEEFKEKLLKHISAKKTNIDVVANHFECRSDEIKQLILKLQSEGKLFGCWHGDSCFKSFSAAQLSAISERVLEEGGTLTMRDITSQLVQDGNIEDLDDPLDKSKVLHSRTARRNQRLSQFMEMMRDKKGVYEKVSKSRHSGRHSKKHQS